MTLKDQMKDDFREVVFDPDEGATAAVYTPVTGDPVACNVWFENNALVQMDGYEAGITTIGTVIEALVADVGTPGRDDTFTIGEKSWKVRRMDSADEVSVRLVVREDR